jgi:hypothetical protein
MMMHLFSCESPSLEMNFCYPYLNLSCGCFPGRAKAPSHQQLEVLCILPKVRSSYMCCSPTWSVLLVRKPDRCWTSLFSGGVSPTFVLFPKHERHSFTSDRVTSVTAGRWSASLPPPKSRHIIQILVFTSLTGRAPNWFMSLFWVPLCKQDLLSSMLGEASSSHRSTGLLVSGGTLPTGKGYWVLVIRRWIHHLWVPDKSPEMLWQSQTEK